MTKQFNPKYVKEFMGMTIWEIDGFYSASYSGFTIVPEQIDQQQYITVADLENALVEWHEDIAAQV